MSFILNNILIMNGIYKKNGNSNFDYEKPYNVKELHQLCAFILVKYDCHMNMHVLQSGFEAVSILTSYRQRMLKIGCDSEGNLESKKIVDDLREFFEYYRAFLECSGEC